MADGYRELGTFKLCCGILKMKSPTEFSGKVLAVLKGL